jgi:malate dehydrogenase (oxaloacetate-decarboxylating)
MATTMTMSETTLSPAARPFVRVHTRGRALLLDPCRNKGTAFSLDEREALGLLGLLPPALCTLEQQLDRCYENFQAAQGPLAKHIYLAGLHDRNEVLFYRLLHEHIDEMMPIVYTPVVGEACQRFSHLYRRARGVYVTLRHRGRMAQVLANWDGQSPSVIVATDGERILGLGDQGAGGMGIPIGKLSLYTLCAGVPPETTLPIMLDVGTDNEERLADPLYLGVRQTRLRGAEYQEFIDEFVEAVRTVYPAAILQWEDFLKENALFQLTRFRDRLTSFNDDIQGTAAVTLGALLASLRVTGGSLPEQRVLMAGAGASAQGIAQLLVAALVDQGLDERDARSRIWMVDRKGLVVQGREGLPAFKRAFARAPDEVAGWSVADLGAISLQEVVGAVRPTMLIGTSTTPGLFSKGVLRTMAEHVERPVVLPLSNPTSKAECTPADALHWTDGRALVATGSPFDPVLVGGRRVRIGQCNNSFVFPGVGLGAWVGGVRRITDGMFLDAARALAEFVSPADIEQPTLLPEIHRIREISHAVACAVIRRAVDEELAEPELLTDLEQRVQDAMWFPEYQPFIYDPQNDHEEEA